jgi:hypothetical protein
VALDITNEAQAKDAMQVAIASFGQLDGSFLKPRSEFTRSSSA